MGETPGPIPNPEAKTHSADGTAPGRVWESRSPPDTINGRGPDHKVGALPHLTAYPPSQTEPRPSRIPHRQTRALPHPGHGSGTRLGPPRRPDPGSRRAPRRAGVAAEDPLRPARTMGPSPRGAPGCPGGTAPAGTRRERRDLRDVRERPLVARFHPRKRPIPVIFPKKGRKHAEFAASAAPSW